MLMFFVNQAKFLVAALFAASLTTTLAALADGSGNSAISANSANLSTAPPNLDKAPASGVQWTKIQDLDPNATSGNRPIKQKWAVVIGTAKFRERRLDASDARMDLAARNFASYLKDEKAGRFPETHVKTLINQEATRQNIMNNLGKAWPGLMI